MGWPARAGTDRPARVESTSGRRAAGGGNPMPRLLKSALTLGLMGVPVWVAIVGAFSSGGADPATLVVRVGDGGGTTVWVDGERFEVRSAEVGPLPVAFPFSTERWRWSRTFASWSTRGRETRPRPSWTRAPATTTADTS